MFEFLKNLFPAKATIPDPRPAGTPVPESQVQPVITVSAPAVVAPVVIAPAPVTIPVAAPVTPVQEKMTLFVQRGKSDKGCTIGKFYVDGVFECFTLEDVIREVPGQPVASWKVQDQTAIPVGTYDVRISFSPHFNKNLPEVLNVPGFTGIRIHPGNFAKDTDGCLLLGETENVNDGNIGSSVAAFTTFFSKLQKAVAAGKKVTIQYRNP